MSRTTSAVALAATAGVAIRQDVERAVNHPTTGTNDVLVSPTPVLELDRIVEFIDTTWGRRPHSLQPLSSERDLNIRVDDDYVLKISNPAESVDVIAMEVASADHIRGTDPGLAVPQTVAARTGDAISQVLDDTGRRCPVRLLTLLPGRSVEGLPITTDLAEQAGSMCARASVALSGYFHPAGGRVIDWDVREAAHVLHVQDAAINALGEVGGQLRALRPRLAAAAARTPTMRGGLQHADVTLTNLLTEDGRISGLIDFGDMHFTAAVCDLAVTLTSVLRNTAGVNDTTELWTLAAAVLNGYQRHRPLEPAEVDIIGDFVIARLALTLVISARRAESHPDNLDYISQYDASTRRVLADLLALDPEDLAERFASLAGTKRARRATATPGLLDRRLSAMGGSLTPLFYAQPVEIVRGSGPWLYDAGGQRYLDAYNNVAVVGHAHPTVTQAVSRQLATVNTHSRYLHPNIVELAERLLATMPAELDTCLFTTSGTEANDLAWRMATCFTGGNAAIVADHAYHGSSNWLADLSPNEWPPGHHPPHVTTFTSPASGGPELAHAAGTARIAESVRRVLDTGDRPALVLADLGFTSAGIQDAPAEFIRGLVDGARDAGALFLADEVQSGFGRSGHMWRFQPAAVTPDFVTLGKPMGAGYPIGALITRREIAGALATRYEYFSTFAATPAAAAASLAVLDVLDNEQLVARAVHTGTYLRNRLSDLAADATQLGGVRGMGLIAGVDVVAPAGENHATFARRLLDALAQRRVLAGLTGPTSAVLKVRPPLVWATEHADAFVDALRDALHTV